MSELSIGVSKQDHLGLQLSRYSESGGGWHLESLQGGLNAVSNMEIMNALHAETSRRRSIALRAAVHGADDGLLSTASLVLGVATAHGTHGSILVAGLAGLIAGSMSMAAGEYVSVQSQDDTEHADLEREKTELLADLDGELQELADIYILSGPTTPTNASPQFRPKRATATAIASSKLFPAAVNESVADWSQSAPSLLPISKLTRNMMRKYVLTLHTLHNSLVPQPGLSLCEVIIDRPLRLDPLDILPDPLLQGGLRLVPNRPNP